MTKSLHEPRAAILDVDGTLYPGAVGVDLLTALVAEGACDPRAAQRVFQVLAAHRAGSVDFQTMARRAYRAFALALAGRRVAAVEGIAREVWAQCRGRLFPFVPELIACLRARGFSPMLISGSPIEMVELVAAELDIDVARGAVFTRAAARYTGAVERSAGMPGEKLDVFCRINVDAPRPYALAHGFAIGNSLTDAVLFERVGLPLAFEPEPDLRALAVARGWTVADRDDVLARVRGLWSPRVFCQPSARAGHGEVSC